MVLAVLFLKNIFSVKSEYFIGDYPENIELKWSDECQGVTNDSAFWYISQYNRIWKFPLSYDLAKDVSEETERTEIPDFLKNQKYDHFGDVDIYKGKLFLTLQNKQSRNPKIVVFKADNLEYIAEANLDTIQDGKVVSASGINPSNGLLYTCEYKDTSEGLLIYNQQISNDTLHLEFIKKFQLFEEDGFTQLVLRNIQGIKFSKTSGLLYVVSDDRDNGGIYIFDPETGKKLKNIKVISWNDPDDFELQGMTICDLDNEQIPQINGQLHLIIINDIGNDKGKMDKVIFRHFRLSGEIKQNNFK